MRSRTCRLPGNPVIVGTGETSSLLPSEAAYYSSLDVLGIWLCLQPNIPVSCSGGWLLLLRVTPKPSGKTWPEDSHVLSFI